MDELAFLDARAAVRSFDPNAVIADEEIYTILEHASNAPSSNNFQPWKVIAVKSKEKQQVLKEYAAGQQQVADASVVFLLFGNKKDYNLTEWETFNRDLGRLSEAEIARKLKRIETYFSEHPEDKGNEGLRLDVGLFAMNLMHVVRTFGYESVPMRGASFEKIKAYLDVPQEWEAILMLPVGKGIVKGAPHARKKVTEFANIIK